MPGLIILLFLGFFGVMMLACGIGFKLMESHQKQRVEQMLKTVSSSAMTVEIKAAPALELAPEAGDKSSLAGRFERLAESGRGDPRRCARMASRGGAVRHGRNGPRGRFPGLPLQSSGVSVAEHSRNSPGPGHVTGLVYLQEAGQAHGRVRAPVPGSAGFSGPIGQGRTCTLHQPGTARQRCGSSVGSGVSAAHERTESRHAFRCRAAESVRADPSYRCALLCFRGADAARDGRKPGGDLEQSCHVDPRAIPSEGPRQSAVVPGPHDRPRSAGSSDIAGSSIYVYCLRDICRAWPRTQPGVI